MSKDAIDLEKAIGILRNEYEIAQGLDYVRHPLSWAVYQVWLMLDEMDKRDAKGEKHGIQRDDKEDCEDMRLLRIVQWR